MTSTIAATVARIDAQPDPFRLVHALRAENKRLKAEATDRENYITSLEDELRVLRQREDTVHDMAESIRHLGCA